jgi:polar amino acid transport system substrate-binding protein
MHRNHPSALRTALSILCIPLFACLLFLPLPAGATEPLQLATGATPPWGPSDRSPGYLKRTAIEAFARVGIAAEVSYQPPERVLINVNEGADDGDVFRIAGMEKKYPNIVMVPEPIATFDFVGFTRTDGEPVAFDGWPSLEPYVVGYMTGWKFYENNVTADTEVTTVSKPGLLLGLLRDRKVDIVLFERWMAEDAARKAGVALAPIEPAFARMPMHIYLNKKHAALAPKLSEALATMKADGTIARIQAETLGAPAR